MALRKKEGDKHTSILDAAIRVFARDGFDRAQIAAIATEAGIGTGSVYLYFHSKDKILDGVFERFWNALLDALQALPKAPPREHLRAQLELLFEHLSRNPDMVPIYLRESHRHALRPQATGNKEREACLALGEQTYEEGVANGCFRPGLPLGLARSFVFGGIRSALSWCLDPSESLHHREAGGHESHLVAPASIRQLAIDLAISVLLPDSSTDISHPNAEVGNDTLAPKQELHP